MLTPDEIKELTPGMLHVHFLCLMTFPNDPDTLRTLYMLHHDIEQQPGLAGGGPDDNMESGS